MKKSISLALFFFAAAIFYSCEKNDSRFGNRLETTTTTSTETFNACETAFARKTALSHAFCFTQLDLNTDGKPDFNRWGWSNGPLVDSPQMSYYNLYAAAGQCDPAKGVLVGRMDVQYLNGTVSIVISTISPYTLDETHLYIGDTVVPVVNGKATVAPGQYSYSHDLTAAKADYYTINGVTGSIYLILHAVVCGF